MLFILVMYINSFTTGNTRWKTKVTVSISKQTQTFMIRCLETETILHVVRTHFIFCALYFFEANIPICRFLNCWPYFAFIFTLMLFNPKFDGKHSIEHRYSLL